MKSRVDHSTSAPSSFAERANAWFWQRVSSSVEVPADSLGLFRWIYGVFLLVETPYFAWIDHVPHGLFNPPILSPAFLLGGFPASPFFSILDAIVVASLCLVTVGYRTRFFTVVLIAGLLAGFNFRYSFGKVDSDIIILMVLVCMEMAGWGNYYSIDVLLGRVDRVASLEAQHQANRGLSLFAVLLSFGMITAGLGKARSWIDFNLRTSGFLMWFYPQYYDLGRHLLLAKWVPHIPIPALELGDYLGPMFELSGFPALLYSRRTWRMWLFIACTFHLMNALLLNIAFNEQALSYLLFVDLSSVAFTRWQRFAQRRVIVALSCFVFFLGMSHIVMRSFGYGSRIVFVSSVDREQPFFLYFCIPICAFVLARLARALVGPHRDGRNRREHAALD